MAVSGPPEGTTEKADYAAALASRQFFGGRLSEQYHDHYHLIASVFNGVVLGGAATSLLLIVRATEGSLPRTAALALWLGSFASLVCTYNGPIVNSILITCPPNLMDVVTPFLMGVLGFAQFAVAVPLPAAGGEVPSSAAQLDHLTWWFLVAAVQWAVVSAHMVNTISHLYATWAGAPAEMDPLMEWCGRLLRQALAGCVATALVLTTVFLLLRFPSPDVPGLRSLPSPTSLQEWQGVMGMAYFAGMVGLVVTQMQARTVIVTSVSAPPHRSDGEGHEAP